ncbi:putative toxin-antitoxin system toxin component, PIN family [uncultured Pseudoramibacter sp.]|uniref:putative toxin-antitoxin system toxin component, PIN family n=1 Tax=uncultured Pseudoramibacter sp. TaxID=1623493 RepID=UPI00342FD282
MVKVFIDTNILISAALFPNSIPFQAYCRAVSYPNSAIICDLNIDELKEVFNRKFPTKILILDQFLSAIMTSITIVKVPEASIDDESKIRDEKDKPIFRAAVMAGADVFLTGDKDFLESGIKDPRIMTPHDFLNVERLYTKQKE